MATASLPLTARPSTDPPRRQLRRRDPGVASTQTAPVITTSVTSLNFVGAPVPAVDPR